MSEDKKPVQEINPFSMGEIDRIHNLMENIPDKDGPNGDSMDLRIWHRDAIKHYEKTKYQLLKTTERLNTILPMDGSILEEIKRQGDDWAIINMSHGTWTKQYILDNWNKDIVMTDDIRHIWLTGLNHFVTNNKIKRLEEKINKAKIACMEACKNPYQCGTIEPNDTDCAKCEWYPVWKALRD